MAQDSLRRLAGELRRFIANQEEDEFILTAAPQRAADILPSASVQPAAQEALPKMPEGETLTVEFTRKPKSITPSAAVEVQPTAETGEAARQPNLFIREPYDHRPKNNRFGRTGRNN